MTINSYKDLKVWQKSIELTDLVLEQLEKFPKQVQFSLVNQLQKSSISVPSNIAEGSARGTKKEFTHFISIARGSLAELETQIIISAKRQYINTKTYNGIAGKIEEISKMLMSLRKSLTKN